jgi:hypothetical protein
VSAEDIHILPRNACQGNSRASGCLMPGQASGGHSAALTSSAGHDGPECLVGMGRRAHDLRLTREHQHGALNRSAQGGTGL